MGMLLRTNFYDKRDGDAVKNETLRQTRWGGMLLRTNLYDKRDGDAAKNETLRQARVRS
jgi:hypothetical protein